MQSTLNRALAYTVARPIVSRELPGWGKIYEALVGGWKKDDRWQGLEPRLVKCKRYGHLLSVDIGKWSDRSLYFLRRWYDLPTLLFAEQHIRPGQTVLDVGSNRGLFSMAASALVTKTGTVHAFDPNPAMVEILRDDLERNAVHHVTVHNMGLSDEEAVLNLTVPTRNSGSATFGELTGQERTVFAAPVKIGDDVLPEIRPDFIKVDVEGFETRAMLGLRKAIERSRPIIVMEVTSSTLERCGSSRVALFKLMDQLGYRGLNLGLKKSGRTYELDFTDAHVDGPDADIGWLPR